MCLWFLVKNEHIRNDRIKRPFKITTTYVTYSTQT